MMNYDIKTIDHWDAPTENGAPLLTMPNVPLPLHGCFRADAEVLTSEGWKFITDVITQDLVATWDMDTETIIWDHPYETIKLYSKQLVRIKQKNFKTFATLVTPDHRIPVRSKLDPRRKCNGIRAKDPNKDLWYLTETTAAKLNTNSYKHFITAARNGTNLDNQLTDAERIYIALQADGSIRHTKMGSFYHNERYSDTKGMYSFRISLKKDRKKLRLERLLDSAGLKYTKQNHDNESYATSNGYQRYDIWVPHDCKNFWKCFDITQFSQQKAQQFIDEISLWDGSCEETCGILNRRYVTIVEDNAKFAQAVAVIAGITSSLQIRAADSKKHHQVAYIIDFLDRDFRTVQSCVKELVEHDDYVYCINVPTSYFVVRDGESKSVMITGNCAPREIMGRTEWDKYRKQVYEESDYTCQASGMYLGKGRIDAHELYSINWKNHTATFERAVGLNHFLHTIFIHSGRALTLFEQGDPKMPRSLMLTTLKTGFTLISDWNREHYTEEPLRVSTTFLDWAKNPQLEREVKQLIDYYKIKFYDFDMSCFNKHNWGKWKLIYNNEEYPTKYANQQEWEKAYKPVEKPVEKIEGKNLNILDAILKEQK